jgi:hypothetical protein
VKRAAWFAGVVVPSLSALLAGWSGVASARPWTGGGTGVSAAQDAKACGPLPSFPAGTAQAIMAGRLTIAPFATVTFDPARDGHINWAQDPFHHPTWVVDFQNGQWIEALIEAYLAGGPNAAAYRDRAKTLLLGWLSHVPADNQTPDTLICSAQAFAGQSWIDNRIPGLLDYHASHGDGAFNHGLKQSLQLLGAGCAYPAGTFGRAARSWREAATFADQSFYSLRFGPGTEIHGHADHMGLTYYARGRNLIVDAGHTGYEQDAYRSWLLSPEAASVLVMPFNPSAPTALIHQAIGTRGQFYEFADTAFGRHPRYRSVYVDQDPDLALVFDRASGASRYAQLWHLDPGLTVTSVTRSYAIGFAPGTQLEIRQIPLPGQVIPAGSTRVVEGQVNPYQGWVSQAALQRTPAPVVTMSRSGSSAAIFTLIAPTAPGVSISASTSPGPGSWYRLRLDIGGRELSFLISPGGDIRAR